MRKLLIKNATILPMEPQNEILYNHSVLITDDTITDIFKDNNKYLDNTTIIDAGNKIVIPGLINAHTHAAMTLLRGFADDYQLKTWLEKYIWPAEKKYMNPKTIKLGTELAILEMLASGTTFFNDMYFWEDEVAKISKKAGIKAYVCEGIIDYPIKTYNVKDKFEKVEYLFNKYKNDSLIKVGISPHSPYTCTLETLQKAKELSNKYNFIYHIHVSETKNEKNLIPNNNELTPVEYLNKLNLIDKNFVAIHCVYLNDKDREILKDKNAGVVYNPVSNYKLASGSAEIYKILSLGIKTGLGTDGATSNNNLNMFKEMNMASLVQKALSSNPQTLSAPEALYMATLGSAKVLGVDSETGSIKKGKKADLVILNPENPHSLPYYNPFSYVVYSAKSYDVETTIVNGKILYHNKEYKTLDKDRILNEVKIFAKNLKTDLP